MFIGLWSFGGLLVSDGAKCVSSNNQPCQISPTLDVNSNEPPLCPFMVSFKKCGGRYNTTDDPYAQIFIPDKVKNMNEKVFNLMSRVNETRFLIQHESFECK